MSLSRRGLTRARSVCSRQNESESESEDIPEPVVSQKPENFADKFNKLKQSREKLRLFIELKDPTDSYSLDLKKYDHNIVDPRTLHVKNNGDILTLADSSIKKMHVNKKIKKNWSKEDIIILAWLLDKYGKPPEDYDEADWKAVAEMIPGKDYQQSMFKWMSLRNTRKTTQKRQWEPRQEEFLKTIVKVLGQKSWFQVSKQLYHHVGKSIKLYRSPKHCRERWACYLDPKVKKGPWKPHEDIILLKEFLSIGKKWSNIAKKLDGRTQNAIKNRFTLLLDKKSNHYKNTKNAISDEAYIASIIENLQVGLMITTDMQGTQNNNGDDHVELTPKKEEPDPEMPALRRAFSLNESIFTVKKEPQTPSSTHVPSFNTVSFFTSLDVFTKSFDGFPNPKPVRFQRLTPERLQALRSRMVRPAVFNGKSLELLVKQEQPIPQPSIQQDPHEVSQSDDEASLPMINLDLPSGHIDEFTSLPQGSEMW